MFEVAWTFFVGALFQNEIATQEMSFHELKVIIPAINKKVARSIEDLEVEFEQPPLSITNHNFRFDDYEILQQNDQPKVEQEDTKSKTC